MVILDLTINHIRRQVSCMRFRSPKAMNISIFRYFSKKGSMIDFSDGTDIKLIASGRQGTIIKASKG